MMWRPTKKAFSEIQPLWELKGVKREKKNEKLFFWLLNGGRGPGLEQRQGPGLRAGLESGLGSGLMHRQRRVGTARLKVLR